MATSTTPTTREQYEGLVGEIETLFGKAAEAETAGKTDEYNNIKKLIGEKTSEALPLKAKLGELASIEASLGDLKSFRDALGDAKNPTDAVNNLLETAGQRPVSKSAGRQFVESKGYRDLLAELALYKGGSIPREMRVSTPPVEVKSLITAGSATSAGAFLVHDRSPEIVDLVGRRPLYLQQLVRHLTTQAEVIDYVTFTSRTNNAAPVAEATATSGSSGMAPESALALAVASTVVQEIKTFIPVTRKALADTGQIEGLINQELSDDIDEAVDTQIISGDGNSPNLLGILPTSGKLTVGSAGTDLDAILDAIIAIRSTANRKANFVGMHPNDFYSTGFATAKDSTGRYMLVDPTKDPEDTLSIWGLKLVVSTSFTENTALVGDSTRATIWDRQNTTIQTFDQHSDWALRGLVAVLATRRLAFAVTQPQAFCTVTAV